MPHKQKSGTFSKKQVRTPGGKVITRYVKPKPKIAHCATCKQQLKGIPRELPSKMKQLPKTMKRPERPHGGVLCSACMRKRLKSAARKE